MSEFGIFIVYEVTNVTFILIISDCWLHLLKAKNPYGRVIYMQYLCWLQHLCRRWSCLNISTACSWLAFVSELLSFLPYIGRWKTYYSLVIDLNYKNIYSYTCIYVPYLIVFVSELFYHVM